MYTLVVVFIIHRCLFSDSYNKACLSAKAGMAGMTTVIVSAGPDKMLL